jgi:hypothetical protein
MEILNLRRALGIRGFRGTRICTRMHGVHHYETCEHNFNKKACAVISEVLSTDLFGHGLCPVNHLRSCAVAFNHPEHDIAMQRDPKFFREYTNGLETLRNPNQCYTGRIEFRIHASLDESRISQMQRLLYLACHPKFLSPLLHRYTNAGMQVHVCNNVCSSETMHEWRNLDLLWNMEEKAVEKVQGYVEQGSKSGSKSSQGWNLTAPRVTLSARPQGETQPASK